MSKVKLFIATSLDGKIARPNGSVDFLNEYTHPEGQDYGYGEFYSGIGTVVMGRKTYEEILGYDVPWPYSDAKTYVLTANKNLGTPTPQTTLLHSIDTTSVRRLAAETDGDLWLVGGGKVISTFLEAGLVDEMTLTLVPRILGAGIPLFPEGSADTHFEAKSAEAFPSGFVNLVYTRKKS